MNGWQARSNYGSSGSSSRGYGDNSGERQQSYVNNFPNSGAIFPVRQKRSDNSPDMTGDIEISEDVLDYIIREAERGGKVKVELSAWIRMSRNNTNFTSLKVNIPYEIRMQQEGNPTYRAQPRNPNFNQRQMERPQSQPQSQYGQRREPPPQRTSVRQTYAEQSGRGQMSDADFKSGDRMPDFGRDDRGGGWSGGGGGRGSDPNDPPF